MKTIEWAKSFGICTEPVVPAVADYDEGCAHTGDEIARRCLIIQGVAAVASSVEPEPIIEWFRSQGLWNEVTPQEKVFLVNDDPPLETFREYQWHMEAEWALLWVIGMVESLGLPTQSCDSRRMVDEILPELGEDIREFVDTARLRPPGEFLAEDDRTYDLWCRYQQAQREEKPLPDDLNYWVLHERRYAFEWLDGNQEWDEVTCDA